jgi:hypothetical protein
VTSYELRVEIVIGYLLFGIWVGTSRDLSLHRQARSVLYTT